METDGSIYLELSSQCSFNKIIWNLEVTNKNTGGGGASGTNLNIKVSMSQSAPFYTIFVMMVG